MTWLEMKLTLIDFAFLVADGCRSSWLQILGDVDSCLQTSLKSSCSLAFAVLVENGKKLLWAVASFHILMDGGRHIVRVVLLAILCWACQLVHAGVESGHQNFLLM